MKGRETKKYKMLLRAGMMFMLFALLAVSVPAVADNTSDDYLHTVGSKIYDANGNNVRLTGIAWFGFETQEQVYHGLWSVGIEYILDTVADHGFNLLRIPLSVQLVNQWREGNGGSPMSVNYYANPDLEGMTSLEILDASIAYCKKIGLKVMLDMHRVVNTGMLNTWYTSEYPASDFEACWQWLAQHYAGDDTVIAMDIFNEPHGAPTDAGLAKWDDSEDQNNWKYEAEKVADLILDINPDLLIVVEGIQSTPKDGYTYAETNSANYYSTWWGGNLRRVKDYPVDLGDRQSQLVYSPHDYGPSVWPQSWFYSGFTKASLTSDCWMPNWLYIADENIAPILVGEWGGLMDGGDNERWMEYLTETIAEYGLNHTFWCVNPNSGDTGGILLYDWLTVDTEKYNLIEPSLWKDGSGKYIGLDHQVDLGANGTHVGTYSTTYVANSFTNPASAASGTDQDISADNAAAADSMKDALPDTAAAEEKLLSSTVISEEDYETGYNYFKDKYKAAYIGRFDFDNTEGPIFSWSTSTIRGRFYGTGIKINLNRLNVWHDSALAVVIDDNEYERLDLYSNGTFTLATGLEKGIHTVEVVKMDEGMSADIQFLGFEVEDGAMLTPLEPSDRIIEIIGDSISVGYGIESDDPNASWDAKYNNGYLAYGPLAARALGAECVNISWSGVGMLRDYQNDYDNVMPIKYWRTLSKNEDLEWGFYGPQSDIIVINLHTNDFNSGIPEEDAFVGAYNDFIAQIREKNQDAYIYCAVGPLVSGDKLIAARDYIKNGVVEYQRSTGENKIGFFEFSENDPDANGWGAGWHPGKKQHEVMAAELVAKIKEDFGW